MSFSAFRAFAIVLIPIVAGALPTNSQAGARDDKSQRVPPNVAASKQATTTKQLTPEEELQQAIGSAGTDRAMLVRNLEGFLAKYPEAQNRTQIYRALVEASLQLRDSKRAADYAERIVALNPSDISITLLAIQLLEHRDDEAALRRALSYATRVLDFVNRASSSERSPRVSDEQWQAERKGDLASTLFLRGDLYMKLKEFASAQEDFKASYQILPAAGAAERLGETAELQKDWDSAIKEYARAFAFPEGKNDKISRKEIRQKLGNVWRLAHGSEEGLGDYLLRTYDEVSQIPGGGKVRKNADARQVSEFTVRKAPESTPFPLRDTKGKVLVLNFWATWCGPCRALEPQFASVAMGFERLTDVVFLAANCDQDESLVPGYLEEAKPRTAVVFADGLDRLFAVNSFPTVIVIDRDGNIAYRSEGFNPDSFEQELAAAVRRALLRANGAASHDPTF